MCQESLSCEITWARMCVMPHKPNTEKIMPCLSLRCLDLTCSRALCFRQHALFRKGTRTSTAVHTMSFRGCGRSPRKEDSPPLRKSLLESPGVPDRRSLPPSSGLLPCSAPCRRPVLLGCSPGMRRTGKAARAESPPLQAFTLL